MKNMLPGIVVLVGAVGCGGVALGSGGGGDGTHADRNRGEDAGIDTAEDAAAAATGPSAPEAGGHDAYVLPKPVCNSSTFNTWQRYPGSSSSSYPGVSTLSSLILGGNLVTTAGVIQNAYVIAPLDNGVGVLGNAYWWYVASTDAWQHRAACATEIYLPTGDAFPWLLVGATGAACDRKSQGVWYPTYPENNGAPSYVQVAPYDAIHAATSFSVDSSGNVYTTGETGTTCETGSGIPYGPCIQKYDGQAWTALANSPGAQQITSGGSESVLFALDQSHGIWSVDDPGSSSWSEISVTSICGGGTLNADLIAANSGFVYAINDAGGGPGSVYSFTVGVSTCWSAVDDSVQMMSISANPQLNGENALLGTDDSNGLWYFCNGNTP